MSITHEDLFALRFALQEIYIDENDIVKKLKIKCLDSGMTEEATNNFLVEFYSIYGITFTLEEIQNINVTPPSSSPNLPIHNPFVNGNPFIQNFSSQNTMTPFNSALIQMLLNPSSSLNQLSGSNISQTLSSDTGEEIENEDLPELIDENGDIVEDDSDDDIPELEDDEDNEVDVNESTSETLPTITLTPSPPIINYPFSYQMSSQQSSQQRNNIPNLLRQIMLQAYSGSPNLQEDVVASLDDEDLANIKSYKFDKNKDNTNLKCTICMTECEDGDEVCELRCGHKFHKECIVPYLENYNYKCPICRQECGKAKYNT